MPGQIIFVLTIGVSVAADQSGTENMRHSSVRMMPPWTHIGVTFAPSNSLCYSKELKEALFNFDCPVRFTDGYWIVCKSVVIQVHASIPINAGGFK